MSARLDHEAVAPAAREAIEHLYEYVRQSGLDAPLVDLVYLRVSQVNGCDSGIDRHSRDLVRRGMPLAKLFHVPFWEDAGLFDERERAALAWAEIVTSAPDTGVPQAAFDAARLWFSEKELADLTFAIGLMNASNRIAISFGTTVPGLQADTVNIRAR